VIFHVTHAGASCGPETGEKAVKLSVSTILKELGVMQIGSMKPERGRFVAEQRLR